MARKVSGTFSSDASSAYKVEGGKPWTTTPAVCYAAGCWPGKKRHLVPFFLTIPARSP